MDDDEPATDRDRVNAANARAAELSSTRGKAPAAIRTLMVMLSPKRALQTLLGGLLDAHPQVAVAHEAHVLRLAATGYTRDRLVWHLLENSRALADRRPTFPRRVPHLAAQGPTDRTIVVGDTKSALTLGFVRDQPDVLVQLQRFLRDVQLRVLVPMLEPERHVAAMGSGKWGTWDDAVAELVEQCKAIELVKRTLPVGAVHTVRMDRLLEDGERELTAAAAALGVDAPLPWLADCDRVLSLAGLPPVPQVGDARRDALYEQLRGFSFLRT